MKLQSWGNKNDGVERLSLPLRITKSENFFFLLLKFINSKKKLNELLVREELCWTSDRFSSQRLGIYGGLKCAALTSLVSPLVSRPALCSERVFFEVTLFDRADLEG